MPNVANLPVQPPRVKFGAMTLKAIIFIILVQVLAASATRRNHAVPSMITDSQYQPALSFIGENGSVGESSHLILERVLK